MPTVTVFITVWRIINTYKTAREYILLYKAQTMGWLRISLVAQEPAIQQHPLDYISTDINRVYSSRQPKAACIIDITRGKASIWSSLVAA